MTNYLKKDIIKKLNLKRVSMNKSLKHLLERIKQIDFVIFFLILLCSFFIEHYLKSNICYFECRHNSFNNMHDSVLHFLNMRGVSFEIYGVIATVLIGIFIIVSNVVLQDSVKNSIANILWKDMNFLLFIPVFLITGLFISFLEVTLFILILLICITSQKIYFLHRFFTDPFYFLKRTRYILKTNMETLLKMNINNVNFFKKTKKENIPFGFLSIEKNKLNQLKSLSDGLVEEIYFEKIKNINDKVKNGKIYFNIGDEIQKGQVLFSFSESKISKKNLQKKLNKCFKMKESDFLDNLDYTWEDLRKLTINTIQNKNYSELDKYLDFYEQIMMDFLENLISKDEIHSYKEAKKYSGINQRTHIFNTIEKIKNHIMDFFNFSYKLNDKMTLYKIRHITRKFIEISIQNKDHLIFRQALHLWTMQLFNLKNDKQSHIEHMRFFKTLVQFVWEQNSSQDEDYKVYILEITKHILEHILDHKSLHLIDHFHKIIKMIISDEDFLRHQIHINLAKESLENLESYESRKIQFLLGIGAELDQEKELNNSFSEVKETIENWLVVYALSISDFIKLSLIIANQNVERFWWWDTFNSRDYTDDEGIIHFRSKSYKSIHYLIKLYSKYISEKKINDFFLDNKNLEKISSFEQISVFPDNYLKHIQEENKKELMNKLFSKINTHLGEQKIKYISNQKLDSKKLKLFVDEFKNTMNKNFKKSMKLLFKDKIQKSDEFFKNSILGMNELEEKSFFISDSKIDLSLYSTDTKGLAQDFAGGFFRGENKLIQEKIINRCEKREEPLKSFIEFIKEANWEEGQGLIVKHSIFHKLQRKFSDSIKYIEKSDSFFNFQLNIKNKTLLIRSVFINRELKIDSILFDQSKIPEIILFDSSKDIDRKYDFKEFLEEFGIKINIGDLFYNEILTNNILTNSKWLKEKGGNEQQKKYLHQHVNIKINQGIHINWKGIDSPIGIAFKIVSDYENDDYL